MNHHHNKLANSVYTCSVSQHGSHLWLCIYSDDIQVLWISFIASGIISSAERQARLDSHDFHFVHSGLDTQLNGRIYDKTGQSTGPQNHNVSIEQVTGDMFLSKTQQCVVW